MLGSEALTFKKFLDNIDKRELGYEGSLAP